MRYVSGRRSTYGLVTMLAALLLTVDVRAQETTQDAVQDAAQSDAAEPDFTFAELKVVLTGPDGEAVVGATVMPYAMRMVEVDGHGFWDQEKFGLPQGHVSDAKGVATIRYPASVKMGPLGRLTTKLVTFQIKHTDYVREVVHCELGPDPEQPITSTDVQLKKGSEVELAAVDSNGARITEFGILMAGPYAADMWAVTEGGGRRTSAVNDGSWQTMLVAPQKDGPTLFSGLLPLRVRPNQAVRLRNVLLIPGSVVLGQLAADVPRPVRNGYAITATAPKPAGSSYDKEEPSLVWMERVSIDEDGKFTLPSIPRSGKIQVIAVCDDFVSKTTMPDAGPFVMGQLFDVVDGTISVTIEMEPTAAVEITIRRPDGSLLDSGKVSAWPNQKYYLGGSTLLGAGFNSLDMVKLQLLPAGEKPEPTWLNSQREFPFSDQPVIDGVAVLRGLPVGAIGANEAILQHDEFAFPAAMGRHQGGVQYDLERGEVTKVEVTTLSREQAAALQEEQAAEARALQAVGGLLQKAVEAVQGK